MKHNAFFSIAIHIFAAICLVSSVYIAALPYDESPFYYCAIPGKDFEGARNIPARNGTKLSKNLFLDQVQMVTRHGSRTPSSVDANTCFPEMVANPIHWNCSYIEQFQGGFAFPNGTKEASTININQIYDAQVNLNELPGTCLLGQLISPGDEQAQTLGDIVYNTYFKEDPLFNASQLLENPELIYFRSTDIQRTRHTGALLLTQLLKNLQQNSTTSANSIYNYTFNVHLMDASNDKMLVGFCDDFVGLYESYLNSNGMKELNEKNKEILTKLGEFYGSEVNEPHWFWLAIDCYMSLLCTDKLDYIPKELIVDPANVSNEDLGTQLYHAIEESATYFVSWKNASLGKCQIEQFNDQFMESFNVKGNPSNHVGKKGKLNYFSAHDSTLLNFLASLDSIFDGKWPPYASLLSFELYKSIENDEYFRIIYNGKDVTSGITGCNDSTIFVEEGVCQFSNLADAVQRSHIYGPIDSNLPNKPVSNTDSNSQNAFAIVISIIAGLLIGILATVLIQFTCLKKKKNSEIGF